MTNEELLQVISLALDLEPTSDPYEFRALCPFHAETNPSFFVNSQKGVFHCFGCGAGGTLRTLVQRLGVNAEKLNLPIQTDILEQAQKFFREQIRLNPDVRDTLRSKGREKFVDRFGLGYAPSDPKALLDYLRSLGFTDDQLRASGLFTKTLFPYLRNRITIPIKNEKGEIIAFAGRSVSDNHSPKYLNTSFQKKSSLYGIHEASELLKFQSMLIVVEGYFDAMSLLYLGYPAVATMGAHLSLLQSRKIIGLLSRKQLTGKKSNILFVPDRDLSGLKSVVRSILYFVSFHYPVFIAFLPEGRDIDELDFSEIQRVIHKALPPSEAIAKIVQECSIDPIELAKILIEVPSQMRKEIYLRLLKTKGNAFVQQIAYEVNRFLSFRKRSVKAFNQIGLWELFVAAVIQKKISPELFPDLPLMEVLPDHLKNVFRFAISKAENLSNQEEQTYARLAMLPIVIDSVSLVSAAIKEFWRVKALQALKELPNSSQSTEQLEELRSKFNEALSNYQSCIDVDVESFLSEL